MNVAYVRASGAIIHLDRLRDYADKWLFFIFFLAGAGAIWFMKEAEFPQWQVTAAPVCLMLLYALYASLSPGFRLREDRAADNLYYLGFLYTLTSLAYSLYLFSQDQGGTTAIISNFGIALMTTIVGLALRVLFSQLREDPLEFEREARHDLSEAVQHLKTELDQSALEFSSFRRALQQTLQEGMDEMLASSRTLLLKHGQQYSHVTGRFVTEFDQAIATFAQESARANTGIAGVATELASLTERINAINAPRDLVKRKIEPAVAAITQLVEQMTAHRQSEMIYFDRFHTLLERVGESHQQLDQTLTRLGEVYGQHTGTLEQHTDQIRVVVAALERLATDASAGIQRQAEAQTQHLDRFSRSTEGLIEQHQRTLATELQAMRDRLSALVQEGADRQTAMAQELHHLRQVIAGIGEIQAPLEQLGAVATAHHDALARLTRGYEDTAADIERYSQALTQTLGTARQTAEALAKTGDDQAVTFQASLNRLDQTLAAAVEGLRGTLQEQIGRLEQVRPAWAGTLQQQIQDQSQQLEGLQGAVTRLAETTATRHGFLGWGRH